MAPPKTASSSHKPIPSSSDVGGRIDEAKNAIISILKNTDWSKEASSDAHGLIQTMETAQNVRDTSKNETQMPEDTKTAIEGFLEELGGVHTRLKTESEKYGTKKKGFGKKVKKFFSRPNVNECTANLGSCRTAIEKSLASLNDHLSDQGVASEQRSLQEAEVKSGVDSGNQPGANISATASLPPSTGFDLALNSAQLDTNSHRPSSPLEVNQPAGVEAKKQKGSRHGELLNGANRAFKFAEGVSGALPVVGGYVGAVAKVGLTVVDVVKHDIYACL